jgi:hypothetical protein
VSDDTWGPAPVDVVITIENTDAGTVGPNTWST